MKGFALVIPTDGSPPEKRVFDRLDEHEFLAWLKQCVGGYIEAIPGVDTALGFPAVAFANEDGLRLNLPPNLLATSMLKQRQVLVGTVVILFGDDEFMDAL